MQPEQLVLPTLATIALGAALLVPLRDDRRGKRATLGGVQPMRTEFHEADLERKQRDVMIAATESTPGTKSDPEPAATAKLETLPPTIRAASQLDDRSDARPDTPTLSDESTDNISEPVRAPFKKRPFSERLKSVATMLGFTPKSACGDEASQLVAPLEHTRSFASELDVLLAPNRLAANHVAPIEIPSREPTPSIDANESKTLAHDVPVVQTQRSPIGRVVPLTRLPLRPQPSSITWTQSLAGIVAYARDAKLAGSDRRLRHALLFSLSESVVEDAATALHVAFREEDAEGRRLVLRAIMQLAPSAEAQAIYTDTLRSGTDDERSIAIDALVRIGERAAIVPALNDRLDAIAAKAALAYVDSTDRTAYLEALEPHVDRTRIDAILSLLAGFVE